MESTAIASASAAAILGKPIADAAAQLVLRMLGKPCDLFAEVVSDQVRMWQWQNRISIFHRASQRLKEHGQEAKPLPPAFLIPLIDASGMIDDEVLQGLFADLIAQANQNSVTPTPLFIETLRRLSSGDARLLIGISKAIESERENFMRTEALNAPEQESVDRLVALGIVVRDLKPEESFGEEELPEGHDLLSSADNLHAPVTIDPQAAVVLLTGYGRQFLAAIGHPVSAPDPNWYHDDNVARWA